MGCCWSFENRVLLLLMLGGANMHFDAQGQQWLKRGAAGVLRHQHVTATQQV
jgi:hypothetical protein